MKKILLITIIFATSNHFFAQCTTAINGVYPDAPYTPNCEDKDEMIIDYAYTSEYSVVQLTKDINYAFFNKLNGSLFGYVTIASEDGKTILAHGSGRVNYTADINKKVRYYSHNSAACDSDYDNLISRNIKCKIDIRTDYCNPTLDCTDGAVIKNVTVGDFSNTSACATNGYNNFTSKVITLNKGTAYNMNVEIGYGWTQQSVSMWIDYNKNLLFDQNEFTFLGQQDNGPGTVSKTITIPTSVPDGEYRIRLRLATVPSTKATWDKSCDISDAYGETEDYTLKIVSSLSSIDNEKNNIQLSPNPVTDYLNISSYKEISEITITNTNGQIIKSVDPAERISLKSLDTGVYFVNIKPKNGKLIIRKIIKK